MNAEHRNTPTHLNCQWLQKITTKNGRLKHYIKHPTSIINTIHTPHTLNTIINNLHQTPPPTPDTIRQWARQHNEWKQAGKTDPHTATPQQLQQNALTTAPAVESFTDAYASMKAEHYKPQETT